MAKKLGKDCKIYIDTTPLAGGPNGASWSEVDKARDVTLNLEAGEADVTARDNSGWRASQQALKDASIELEMVWDPSDAQCEAIRDAFLNSSALAVAVMDGDVTTVGTEGFVADCEVINFTRSEPLEEAVTHSVTLKPKDNHQWWEVAC